MHMQSTLPEHILTFDFVNQFNLTQSIPSNCLWPPFLPRPHSAQARMVVRQGGERTLREGSYGKAEDHLSVERG